MKRRTLVALFCASLAPQTAISAVSARAEKREPTRRIGILLTFAPGDPDGQARLAAFQAELQRLGWRVGDNIAVAYRWAALDREATRRAAKELVAMQPDLIVAQNTPATAAVLDHTRTIPTIFFQSSDPVGSGLVASEPRPAGNVTGFIDLEDSLGGKWLELLKEVAPAVASVAFIFNPATARYAENFLRPFKATAATLQVEAIAAPVNDRAELEDAIVAHARKRNGGIIVMPEAFTGVHRALITALAGRLRLPAIYPYRMFTQIGGLLSYGIDLVDLYRRAADYADRVLRGTAPGTLPVQRPVRFELTINLKTARALGLAIPEAVMLRADALIE